MFIGKDTFVNATSYKRTNWLLLALAKLYYPIARYRVTHLEDRWPIESLVAKRLGLFARQG